MPYVSLWIYVLVPTTFLRGKREIRVYTSAVCAMAAAGLAVFWRWPTAIPVASLSSAGSASAQFLKTVDAAGNACPSLHVAFAVFTAVAMIVPYFGALASSVIPILYALTFSPGKAIVVAIIYILAHQLESNVIQPQVVARTVELHPAVVAIGVLAVAQLFGFVGLIVAVPILATVRILIEELWIAPMEERRHDTLAQQPAQIAAVRESVKAADGG